MKNKILLASFGLFLLFNIAGCESTEVLRQKDLERQRQEELIKQQELEKQQKEEQERQKELAEFEANKKEVLNLLNNKKYKDYGLTFKGRVSSLFYKGEKDNFAPNGWYTFFSGKVFNKEDFSNLDFDTHPILVIPKNSVYIFQYLPKKFGSLVKGVDGENNVVIYIDNLEGVDGQKIKKDLILTYSGNFTYKTVLDNTKTIYSFDCYDYYNDEFTEDFMFFLDVYGDDKRLNEGKFFKEVVWPIILQHKKDVAKQLKNVKLKTSGLKSKLPK